MKSQIVKMTRVRFEWTPAHVVQFKGQWLTSVVVLRDGRLFGVMNNGFKVMTAKLVVEREIQLCDLGVDGCNFIRAFSTLLHYQNDFEFAFSAYIDAEKAEQNKIPTYIGDGDSIHNSQLLQGKLNLSDESGKSLVEIYDETSSSIILKNEWVNAVASVGLNRFLLGLG